MPDYTAGKARILLEPTARGFFSKAKAELRKDLAAGGGKLEQDVRLRPIATGFRADAEATLKSLREVQYRVKLTPHVGNRHIFAADAKEKANVALAGMKASIAVAPWIDTTKATNQLRAWRLKEEAKPLKIKIITEHVGGVGRNANQPGGGATQQILQPNRTQAFGHTVPILGNQPTITPQLNTAPAAAKAQALKNQISARGNQPKITPQIDPNQAHLARLKKQIDDALKPRRVIGPSFRGVELLQPSVLAIASQALPALTSAAGYAVGALNQLAGAAFVIPGAMAVMGSSIATVVAGLSGMGDAFKAMSAAQEASVTSADTDAARFESSQNQMRNALVDQQKAQEDLTRARKDARRELEDLHDEERSSYLTVAEAALSLQEARNELASSTARPGTVDYNQNVIRELRARESLKEALQRQGRAREDVADADKKGIENSDRVVQAQEALVRSNQQVAQSLNALKNESSAAAQAQDKVDYALSKLSPAAGDAVRTLFDLKDKAFIPLRNAISENMFANFSRNIRALVDADLPVLHEGLTGIATGINQNLTQAMESLRTPGTQSILERIFGNTEEFHKRLTAAIDPAIRGLGTLAAAGSDAMPRIATGFGKLMERFAGFIEQADKDGRLDQWINDGIEGVSSLATSFGNILKALHEIGDEFGGGLLGLLERATKNMADFFGSAEGKNTLRDLIRTVKRDFEDWRPVLQDFPAMFMGIMEGGRTAMHAIMPLINGITSLLKAFPGLAQGAFAAFIAWRFLRPTFAIVSTGIEGIVHAMGRITPAATTAATGVGTQMTAIQRSVNNNAKRSVSGLVSSFPLIGPSAARATTAVSTQMGRMSSSIRNTGIKAVGGLRTAMGGFASFLGGPWGAAIGTAVLVLGGLATAHDAAKESADEQRRVVDELKGSLDAVTQSAGNATRAMLGEQLENYQPEAGMTGNVRQAVETMGIDRSQFMRALLPGGQGLAKQFNEQFFNEVKPSVLEAVHPTVRGLLRDKGISEDDLVRAFLGDRAQVERIQSATSGPMGEVPVHMGGFGGFDLGEVQAQIEARGGRPAAAALGGQYLNRTFPAINQAQEQARQGQQTATGGVPTLTAEGNRIFGANAKPFWDGNTGVVEVPGMLSQATQDALKERGNQVSYDSFGNVTTITLSDEDRQALMQTPAAPPVPPGRKEGGPSPEAGPRGPTGGVMTELHGREWILPEHARTRLGDQWLWEQTRNKTMKRSGNSYFWGGPFPLTPPLPGPTPSPTPAPSGDGVIPPGVGTGPAPGPGGASSDPAAPAATPQIGVSHAGGPGVPPGDPMDPNASALLNEPMPTVDADGNLVSPEAAQTPDIGTAFQDMFLAPWGFKTGPDGQPMAVGGGGGTGEQKSPGQWLGEWGGEFLTSLGETAINGVLGFFGLSTDNTYFNALKKTLGFYSSKLGQGQDQQVDPATQALINSNVEGYTTLVDPATGTTYLVPSDGATGDLPELTPGATTERLKDTGSVASGPQSQRAASLIMQKWGDAIRGNIGGSRDENTVAGTHDAGLSIDVPIGEDQKELGDEIAEYFKTHKDALGVEYVLWQQKDHFDHIDIHFNGTPGAPAADDADADLPADDLDLPDLDADSSGPPLTQIPSADNAPAPGGRPAAPRSAGVIPPGWKNVNAPWAKTWMLVPDSMYKQMGSSTAPPKGWYWERNDPHAPTDPSGGRAAVLTREGQGPGTPAYNKIWGGPKGRPQGPGLGIYGPSDTVSGAPPFLDFLPPELQRQPKAPAFQDLLPPELQRQQGPGPATITVPGGSMGPGGRPMPGSSFGRKVVVLPRSSGGFFNAAFARLKSGRTGGSAGSRVAPAASSSRRDVAQYVYRAARSRGLSKREALAVVAYAEGESSLNPGISGGSQAAGGGTGGAADVVIGLFQQKPGFARAGGIDPEDRYTVEGNTTAYLNNLMKHRGEGDIYDQLLATSVGGPMYTGGRGYMAELEKRVLPLLKGATYDQGGLLKRGLTLMRHNKDTPDVVVPGAVAKRTVAQLKNVATPPAPKPPPDLDVARQTVAQPLRPRPPAPTGPPMVDRTPPPPPQAPAPAQPTAAAARVGPPSDSENLAPGIKKGIAAGAEAAANAVATGVNMIAPGAGSAAGGLIKVGGKIAADAANVAATFAKGWLEFGGTTPNPYGVQLGRKDSPPPLAQDNRRVHQGNNYFASMDEWRRKNQLQDAQDMQAGLARVK